MSIYSDISKSIGFHSGVSIRIPEMSASNDLLEKVKAGDVDAFREVFRIYRYASTPDFTNEEGIRSLNIITEAFRVGCNNPDWK